MGLFFFLKFSFHVKNFKAKSCALYRSYADCVLFYLSIYSILFIFILFILFYLFLIIFGTDTDSVE